MGSAPSSTFSDARSKGGTAGRGTRSGRAGRRQAEVTREEWQEALRDNDLSHTRHRQLRARYFGRETDCKVWVTNSGFSLHYIRICEGQVLTFHWNQKDEDGGGRGRDIAITQVVDNGADRLVPVVGGVHSGPASGEGRFEHQFNLVGNYTLSCDGTNPKSRLLTIEVFPRKEILTGLTDDGFVNPIIRIDEGNSVVWGWTDCSNAHSVVEAAYSSRTGGLTGADQLSKYPHPLLDAILGFDRRRTRTGSAIRQFHKPGLFYFQTEGRGNSLLHTCIVHVRERQREERVEVTDEGFYPPLLRIEEGDRVWWEWHKEKCAKVHGIVEMEVNKRGNFETKSSGFKWPTASKSGLMSHEFFTPGIYYFTETAGGGAGGGGGAGRRVGTILVKPKTAQHFVDFTRNGFNPEVVRAAEGDLVWWTWRCDEVEPQFIVAEMERCVAPAAFAADGHPHVDSPSSMDDQTAALKVEAGLELFNPSAVGVYHFRQATNGDTEASESTCSVLVNAGPRNHMVHVTDEGPDPPTTRVRAGDRVWWIWPDGSRPHNVIEVSGDGREKRSGFNSGALTNSPAAFQHEFEQPGVFYYKSDGSDRMGQIVVEDQPKTREVRVTPLGVEPVEADVGDVIAWTFPEAQQSDLRPVRDRDDALRALDEHNPLVKRRVISKVCTKPGEFFYAGKPLVVNGQGGEGGEARVSRVRVRHPEGDYDPHGGDTTDAPPHPQPAREAIIPVPIPHVVVNPHPVPPPQPIPQLELQPARTVVTTHAPPRTPSPDPELERRRARTPRQTPSPPRLRKTYTFTEIIENMHSGRPSTARGYGPREVTITAPDTPRSPHGGGRWSREVTLESPRLSRGYGSREVTMVGPGSPGRVSREQTPLLKVRQAELHAGPNGAVIGHQMYHLPEVHANNTIFVKEPRYDDKVVFPEAHYSKTISLPQAYVQKKVQEPYMQKTITLPKAHFSDGQYRNVIALPEAHRSKTIYMPNGHYQGNVVLPEAHLQKGQFFEGHGQKTITLPEFHLPKAHVHKTIALPEVHMQKAHLPQAHIHTSSNLPKVHIEKTITLPEAPIQRNIAVPEAHVQRIVYVPPEVHVPEAHIEKTITLPHSHFQMGNDLPQAHIHNNIVVLEPHMEKTITLPKAQMSDGYIHKTINMPEVHMPEAHIQKTITLPHAHIEMTDKFPEAKKTISLPEAHIVKTIVVEEPHIEKTITLPKAHVHNSITFPEAHVHKTIHVSEPHIQHSAVLPETRIIKTIHVSEPHIQQSVTMPEAHISKTITLPDAHAGSISVESDEIHGPSVHLTSTPRADRVEWTQAGLPHVIGSAGEESPVVTTRTKTVTIHESVPTLADREGSFVISAGEHPPQSHRGEHSVAVSHEGEIKHQGGVVTYLSPYAIPAGSKKWSKHYTHNDAIKNLHNGRPVVEVVHQGGSGSTRVAGGHPGNKRGGTQTSIKLGPGGTSEGEGWYFAEPVTKPPTSRGKKTMVEVR